MSEQRVGGGQPAEGSAGAGRRDEATSAPRKARAGKLTRQERSWVLYDVGNSAFVLLSTALVPVYFASLAEPGSSVVVACASALTGARLL